MTEIKFPDTDSSNGQWESICTSYEKCLSIFATKKRDLEIRNDELVKINVTLNTNYKILKETISELLADKRALVTDNSRLQKSLDYLREILGYRSLVQRQKVDAKTSGESRDRNRISEARLPVQKEDVHATTTATPNARTEKIDCDDQKHNTRSLELSCDCGTTFKVSGDSLSSIEVKHGTSTTMSCQCRCQNRGVKNRRVKNRRVKNRRVKNRRVKNRRVKNRRVKNRRVKNRRVKNRKVKNNRAKNSTDTPAGAEEHIATSDPVTQTSLRSGGGNDHEISENMENLISLIMFGLLCMFLIWTA
jgi:hypothetical protein